MFTSFYWKTNWTLLCFVNQPLVIVSVCVSMCEEGKGDKNVELSFQENDLYFFLRKRVISLASVWSAWLLMTTQHTSCQRYEAELSTPLVRNGKNWSVKLTRVIFSVPVRPCFSKWLARFRKVRLSRYWQLLRMISRRCSYTRKN